jgi:hypothetical protein
MSQPNQNQGQGQHQAPKQQAQAIQIAPFIVECGDDRNRGRIPIDVLKLHVRGRWHKAAYSRPDGGRSIGDRMSKFPDTPGIRLEVKPREGILRIFDPLETDTKLMDAINRAYDEVSEIKTGRKQGAWPEDIHNLDVDEMKSLLLEIAKKVHAPPEQACMFVIKGVVPTVKELADVPGRELYDPWSNSTDKPKYVDQVPAWRDRWERLLLGAEAIARVS